MFMVAGRPAPSTPPAAPTRNRNLAAKSPDRPGRSQSFVNKINTLVDKNNVQMMSYFNAEKFKPSKTVINLERSI
jgi:hypothetical protein